MKIKTRRRQLCVTVLLWLLTIKCVKCKGKLDILFISFHSDGTEISGLCCDSGLRRCLDKCDPMFSLCIIGSDSRQPCSLHKSTTNYIDNHNDITFGSSIQGTANPFIIQVDKGFPSSIEITVEVYDNDDTSSDDHMDTLSKLINIQAASTQQSAMYTTYILYGRTKLEISVRAYCDPDWYGSACEKYCKVTSDLSHYTCHQDTGAKICFEGEKYCKVAPDLSHYTCHPHTGVKICFEGWKGDNCSVDIDECTETNHICENGGSCTNTHGGFECICLVGIEGTQCENIINQCALKPCLNGGTCDGNEWDFKCACPVEWSGETCADKVNFCDSSPCNMGQCTPDLLTATRFKCDCDFAWVGDRCNQSVDIVNITLLGEINHANGDDLANGLKRLIAELGELPGKVDVKLTTNTQRESNCTTTFVQLYTAVENGSFLGRDLLTGIFESNPDEIINEYLPLPLYPPREEEEVEAKSPDDSWDSNQHVSAILPPVGLVLICALLLVAFCIWRRRSNKTGQCVHDNQLCNRNLQPSGAMTRNLQEASISPDGYTSLRFLRTDEVSHGTHCGDTSNINLAAEDLTLDLVGQQGFGVYPDNNARSVKAATFPTHPDDTSNIHLENEDMTLDDVIAHSFRVTPNDNVRLGDAAKLDTNCEDTTKLHLSTEDMTNDEVILRGLGISSDDKAGLVDVGTLHNVTNDLTHDPVVLQDAGASPHDNTGPSDEVATPDTHCDETSDALPATEDGSLSSVCLQGRSGNADDKPRQDTHLNVTTYIHPVPGDIILEAEEDVEGDDEEYTVIDDNDVGDPSKDDPYETIECLDDENDVEKTPMKR